MFDRMQYRLWKHLDKRFGAGTNEGGGDVAALRRDVEDLRTILLSQICAPDLFATVQKFQIPVGERGNSYVDYLRQRTRSHDRVLNSIADEKLALVETLSSYQSDVITVDEIESRYRLLVDEHPEISLRAYSSWLHFLCERANVTGSLEFVCDQTMRHPKRDWLLDSYVWRQAICAYRYLGKEENAREALRDYLRVYGPKGLSNWPAFASLAVEAGVSEAACAASVFSDVVQLTNERRFENAISGRRVALVGSGPQLRGSGRGAEIDAYDIVVRMNNYNLTDSLAPDYGYKTTAWVRAVDLVDEFKGREKGSPAYSLMTFAFFVSPYAPERIRLFRQQLDRGHVIQAMPPEIYRGIIRQTGLHHPSGGARFACYLKNIVPEFSSSDCFAFSFLENEVKPWYRADGTLNKITYHNLAAEQKPMQAILSAHRK